jgi:glycosyltransferase involved in cell wall biosynthesis
MRILVIGAVLNKVWKGGEPYIARTIVQGLIKRGHEVYTIGIVRKARNPLTYPLYDPSHVKFYIKAISRIDPDIILGFYDYDCSIHVASSNARKPLVTGIHIWWPLCPALTLYSKRIGISKGPSVFRCFSCQLNEAYEPRLKILMASRAALWNLRFRRLIDLLNESVAIIVPAHHMKYKLEAYGLRNIYVINNGINLEEFDNVIQQHSSLGNSKTKIILNPSGYADERKGFRHFVLLARILKSRYNESIEFIATGFKMQGVVKGLGHISRTEYLNLLAQSYTVILPYLWEDPFPMVSLEAMAMGKPIIAYRAGGLEEIVINGVTGILVPRGDINALVNATQFLLENPNIVRKMSKNAREIVKSKYSSDKMISEYERLLLRFI